MGRGPLHRPQGQVSTRLNAKNSKVVFPEIRNPKSAIPVTLATALWLAATIFIALAILNGIASDLLWARFDAWLVLAATLVELGAAFFFVRRTRAFEIVADRAELFGFLALVSSVTAYLVYPSLPALLPPSRHFDAAHHAIHVQFIFDNGTLPDDPARASLYLMTGYPAGGAVFVALVAHWFGSAPIQTIHPVISLIIGLTAGLGFLFICHLLQPNQHRKPIAFFSTLLLFTAWDYFIGSVNERYFFAQAFAQYFALATFFFAYFLFTTRGALWLVLLPFSLSLVLVTHPTPIVAPALMTYAAILLQRSTPFKTKLVHACLVSVLLGPVTLFYVLPHLRAWVSITGYGEAAPFGIDSIGIFLPLLGIAGGALALQKESRATFGFALLIALAILTQPLALFIGRFFLPTISPYYFDKSIYLLIYPLAILAALPLLRITQYAIHTTPSSLSSIGYLLRWLIALVMGFGILIFFPPRPFAPLTASELDAARWAKQNVDANNLAVVSTIREDAYWVYAVVFGSHPSAPSAADAYALGSMTYKEWRANPREPDYALVRNIAREPMDAPVETVWQSGESAILRKVPTAKPQAPSPRTKSDFRVGDAVKLIGYDASAWTPGESARVTFYWETSERFSARTNIFVQIVDLNGNVVARKENDFLIDQFPTQHYPLGVVIADQWDFILPPTARLGAYSVELGLYSKLTGYRYPITDSTNRAVEQLELRGFAVALPTPSLEEVNTARALDARFDSAIALRAYTLSPARRGESLTVTLYWVCANSVKENYTVFIHLIDANGQIIAQSDAPPQEGARPTSSWNAGEFVKDIHRLTIPRDAPTGNATIGVGLYTPADLRRVPAQIPGQPANDFITLPQTITIQ